MMPELACRILAYPIAVGCALALIAGKAGAQNRLACTPATVSGITIAATTDVHGHIRGWDYYSNSPDPARGLSRAATIVDSVRTADRGHVVLVDAGDILQGTPLAYVTRHSSDSANAIIAAMNTMRYDAAAIGNHEFNYGVPYLDGAIAQARFPMLAANVTRSGSGNTFRAYTMVARGGLSVGIVGATTPGSNLWDASNLKQAGLHVGDVVPAVRHAVQTVRARGADMVIVVLHSGLDEPSSYDTVTTGVASENVAARVAAEVPGINVVVYGHSHRENAGQVIGTTLLMQPRNWATSVAVASVPATCTDAGTWSVGLAHSVVIQSAGHAEDSSVVRAIASAHRATVAYVNSRIGSTPDAWRADSARMIPTPLMNFILSVEQRVAHTQLASTAAFDLRSHLGPGAITIAQLAQLYPYANTLRAVRVSGAELRAYIEFSNRYYLTEPDGRLVPDTSVAGYNFDVVSGVNYTVDVRRPPGKRVVSLTYHGRAVAPTDTFTMALNNYRQSGGGGYAMLKDAPVIYDEQQDIRQLLIDEVRHRGTIRKADYDSRNWSFIQTNPK
jgi:2',3'-cyclic-nucleotide 2'-phosphodiesterase/3'-nucleotidase